MKPFAITQAKEKKKNSESAYVIFLSGSPDTGDASLRDANVGNEAGRAQPVDDGATADQQVEVGHGASCAVVTRSSEFNAFAIDQ